MDHAAVYDNLATAERHVAQGAVTLARQRAVIAELELEGRDTKEAWELLQHLKQSQAVQIAIRDYLRADTHPV